MATRRKPAGKKAPAKKPATGRGRGKSKARTVSVDFTDVESRVTLPEGEYRMKVEEVTEEEGSEFPYLKWKFKTVHGTTGLNNKPVYTNTSLSPNSLWNLRNLLEALGVETPDSAYEFDLDSPVDMEMVGTIEHDVYENDDGDEKTQMRIVDYIPLTDGFEESTGGVVDDDDEEDDVDDEEDEDDSDDEDDDDQDEDGDDDGDNITTEEVQDMNAEELTEVVEAYELEVDFKGMRSLRKKQTTVVDALTEAGYIDE